MSDDSLSREELYEAWAALSNEDRLEGFQMLPRGDAEELFFSIGSPDQACLVQSLPADERRSWVRLLPPDDVADLVQQLPEPADRFQLLELLDEPTRKEVTGLLAYAEDEAGGLMNPRYARLRPDMSVDEAISYLRKQKREHVENIYYAYVVDPEHKLVGVVSFRELITSAPATRVRDVMRTDLVAVPEEMDQEQVSHLFAQHDLMALPVVDAAGRMKGIVSADDIVDVVKEEATEDMQKIGGMQALDDPYFQVGLLDMIRKRVGWLAVLFIGESFTATAMAYFEDEIKRVVALALFVPLIVSSGGNSGSQASSLMVRAMALGEVRLRDWWHVMRRELLAGTLLGLILGVLGALRVGLWEVFHRALLARSLYGDHVALVALTLAVSVSGVVLWGSLVGSMLPFALRRLGFDPASASAPFVATLVDVTGLVIYFGVASVVLAGTLL